MSGMWFGVALRTGMKETYVQKILDYMLNICKLFKVH